MSSSTASARQPVEIHLVDAFTTSPFRGNPAGVCHLSNHASWDTVPASWMQSVAMEMNQAETAFLIRQPASPHASYLLRWFTPASEVDLCGHATLASSHYLFTHHVPLTSEIRFETRSGQLIARHIPTDSTSTTTSNFSSPATSSPLIELDFPSDPPALIAPSSDEYQSILPILQSCLHLSGELTVYKGKFDYLVLFPSPDAVTTLRPDFSTMSRITTRGVGVTAQGGEDGVDFVSRFFAPTLNIDEDPVTGSAHCMLAEYWGDKLGKDEMRGYQASKRGGEVRVKRENGRVKLRGYATHTLKGHLLV